MPTTPTEITDTNPMIREINRGLMVHWINADLVNRAHHDVRTSVVLYDDAKMFAGAMTSDVWSAPEMPARLAKLGVHYFSQGIV